MLMQNGGYLPPSLYYQDHIYLSQHTTPPSSHIDVDFFGHNADQHLAHHHHNHRSAQPHHHHHHHHHQQIYYASNNNGYTPVHSSLPPSVGGGSSCACACPPVPVQETFLHKILTGKGYENAAVRMDHASRGLGALRGANHYPGDYAMAASCCYAGLAALPMSAAYPGSISSIQ